MKQKIIFGSILSVFILMILPSIPAVEYDAAVEANESNIIDKLQDISVTDFKEMIQKMNMPELRDGLKKIIVKNEFEGFKEKIKDNPAQPQCIVTFIALILLLKLFGSIIGSIFAAVSAIVDIASAILGKIISLAITILKPIVKLTVLSLIAYFVIAASIDLIFLFVFIIFKILTRGSLS